MRAARLALVVGVLGAVGVPRVAGAHEFRPALMTIDVGADGSVAVTLVASAGPRGEVRPLEPRLPAPCVIEAVSATETDPEAPRRWRGRCGEDGPRGRLSVDGLGAGEVDVVVEVRRASGEREHGLLRRGAATMMLGEASPAAAGTYVGLGVEHILGGVDHLLFVAGLAILVAGTGSSRRGWLALLATLTAFTAAHSLSLAAATLGWVRVAGAPVEACIALSIVLLAREVVLRGRACGASEVRGACGPWGFAFACGLLHGLGFAGALAAVGLPSGAVAPALLAFNAGVEVGQAAAAAAVLVSVAALGRLGVGRGRIAAGGGHAIGVVAAAWTIARVLALGAP